MANYARCERIISIISKEHNQLALEQYADVSRILIGEIKLLIIYVKHYLNDLGIHSFDLWFKDCIGFLSKQDGFQSLHRAFDNTDPEAVHIWLHFENREKMLSWGNSIEHDSLIARLDPYRTKDWEATWYDTDKAFVEKFVIPKSS